VVNWASSCGVAATPLRALAKIVAAIFVGAELRRAMIHAVIGKPAAVFVEEGVPRLQGFQKACEIVMSTLLAISSLSTHALKPSGWFTVSALSGRNAG
jgi:hypothetical protein